MVLVRFSLKQDLSQHTEQRDRNQIPLSVEKQLRARIAALAMPEPEVSQILQRFKKGMKEWRMNPNVMNHTFVLLYRPSAIASSEVIELLFEQVKEAKLPFHKLDWAERPEQVTTLVEKLRHQIGGAALVQAPEVLAIPNLNWCFLRHAEGLDGIDFICQTLLNDKQRFWIIVTNTICWDYLSAVTSLDACCTAPTMPFSLSGEALQSWLEPIVSEFSIEFSAVSFDMSDSADDQNPKKQYFESLARISEGDRTIAAELFLRSLTLDEESDEDADPPSPQFPLDDATLIAQHPTLPSLPPVDPEDLYILYSLLLHGGLKFKALAESLGNPDLIHLQPRLQKLCLTGVIQHDNAIYTVHPVHYPRLKRSLINNNFVIHQELD